MLLKKIYIINSSLFFNLLTVKELIELYTPYGLINLGKLVISGLFEIFSLIGRGKRVLYHTVPPTGVELFIVMDKM